MPRDTLVNWALASEKYERNVKNQTKIYGGLHDYINTLSNKDIISYILKKAHEYPEIANKDKLDSLTAEYGISSKNVEKPIIGGDGGLHDYIWTLPKEKLMNWALTSETYHRDINHQHLLGGLHDYISALSNQQLIDYIMNQVKEHPELSKQGMLDSLSQKYNINVKSSQSLSSAPIGGFGGLHDYIWKTERSTLNKWALATEAYHRNVNNQQLLGGLHDYINTLSNQQVIEYVLKEAKEHPEIASAQQLNGLVTKFSISEPTPILNSTSEKSNDSRGGLHDYIWRTDRETLNKWALTSENYHRKVNNLNLFGGLHDFISTLSNEQVINYILNKTKDYPELASAEKLNSLSAEYGITGKDHQLAKMGGDGGLHDFIWRLPRTTLERWAFAAEKYHNKNQMILGGLHDYIGNLDNKQVIEYIMQQVKEHPEIASAAKLDSLVTEYGLAENDSAPSLGASGNIYGGGLHDVVATLERSSLIAYALAMDSYSHEKQPRIGGIHDYVNQLEDNQIRNFILKQAQNFPELNSRIAVEGLIKKYNINVNLN